MGRASIRAGIAALAITLGGAACGGSTSSGARVPNAAIRIPLEVYDYTLPNGMRVVLDEDRSAPIVAVHVRYKVGSKDDPPRRGGFAHLFEHLMFQGTHSIEGNVMAAMQRAGATSINASTDLDRTEYHETMPSGALEWALWFEAERMATMGERLDQATFDRERNVVKNELRQHYENVEGGFLQSIRDRALFGANHPYGHPTIGTIEELDAATLEEVRAFHKKFYQPASAVLSLVGDFDRKQANAWIAQYFGAMPKVPVTPVRTAPPEPLGGERRVLVEANVPYPSVTVTYVAPPDGSPELAPLSAMAAHISGTVDWWLVERRSFARDVSSSVHRGMLASTVSFTVKLAKDSAPEEALRVLDKAIFEEPPSSFGSINAPINRLKLGRLFDYETFAERAEMYAYFDDLRQNPLFIARELEALQRAGRAEAFEARQRFLQKKDRLITVVSRNPSAPLGGRVVEGG